MVKINTIIKPYKKYAITDSSIYPITWQKTLNKDRIPGNKMIFRKWSKQDKELELEWAKKGEYGFEYLTEKELIKLIVSKTFKSLNFYFPERIQPFIKSHCKLRKDYFAIFAVGKDKNKYLSITYFTEIQEYEN
jgi:hypothetical protein